MANLQISTQGEYYESSQPSVDPSKVNDFSKRIDQEQKSHPDIERASFQWKEVWNALCQYQIPVEQHDTRQELTVQHSDLVHQCNILKDLVQGLIVGDRNAFVQEQQYNYIQLISAILQDLSDIEMSEQYRQLTHQIKHQQNNHLLLQKQLQQTITKLQKKDTQVDENQQAIIEVCAQDQNQTQVSILEKRLDRIEKYIGMNQLTQVGRVRDFTLSFKGQPIITSSNFLEGKMLTFKPSDALTQTTYTQQIPQPDAMPILQHIQYLRIALEIINGDTSKFTHILVPEQVTLNISEAIEIGKKYESQLIGADEIPLIVDRLQSLQNLHNDSIQLPEDIEKVLSDLIFMEYSLQETDELLDLLDKQINENIEVLKDNITKL